MSDSHIVIDEAGGKHGYIDVIQASGQWMFTNTDGLKELLAERIAESLNIIPIKIVPDSYETAERTKVKLQKSHKDVATFVVSPEDLVYGWDFEKKGVANGN